MQHLTTDYTLDTDLVERTAKAIYRAKLQNEEPNNGMAWATDAEFDRRWEDSVSAFTRRTARNQATAAIKASALLERVVELEASIVASPLSSRIERCWVPTLVTVGLNNFARQDEKARRWAELYAASHGYDHHKVTFAAKTGGWQAEFS
jgi:hypothetical protein